MLKLIEAFFFFFFGFWVESYVFSEGFGVYSQLGFIKGLSNKRKRQRKKDGCITQMLITNCVRNNHNVCVFIVQLFETFSDFNGSNPMFSGLVYRVIIMNLVHKMIV